MRLYVRAAVPGYLGTIALLTAIISGDSSGRAQELGLGMPHLVLLGLLADSGFGPGHRADQSRVTDLFGPRTLPRLELSEGVPEDLRTIVVVPRC